MQNQFSRMALLVGEDAIRAALACESRCFWCGRRRRLRRGGIGAQRRRSIGSDRQR